MPNFLTVRFGSVLKTESERNFGFPHIPTHNNTFTRHEFLVVTVKEWLKLVYFYQSYRKNNSGVPLILDHPVGEGFVYFEVSLALYPKGAQPQWTPLLGVLSYLCIYDVTWSD